MSKKTQTSPVSFQQAISQNSIEETYKPPFVIIPRASGKLIMGIESESTLNHLIRTRQVPTPYKIGQRLTGFRSDELTDWLMSREQSQIMEAV